MMKWEAWYYDYINGNKKTYIYVEADSFDEAIAKARCIDLRTITARAVSDEKALHATNTKPYKHRRTR